MLNRVYLSGRQKVANRFDYCDIVTSTTHKSLRGPRVGVIFYRRGTKPRKQGLDPNQGDDSSYDFEERVNLALYPSLQGGPHNVHIATLAIALKQVKTPEYKVYMQQVTKSANALASALLKRKCRLVTDGTDNHMLLWDRTTLRLIDRNYEKVWEACYITLNKCAILGSIFPRGVRIGTPAMISRACLEDDFETIADFLVRAARIALYIGNMGNHAKIFLGGLKNNENVIELRNRLDICFKFAIPGFNI